MARPATKTTKATYRCSECGWTTPKWVGRCGECQAWGSVSEIGAVSIRTAAATHVERPAVPIGQVDARRAEARSTGVGEFDRVLGGGLVAGAVVLVAGEPGIGKSTLLLDVAAQVAQAGGTVLYVSGEESAAQVRVRAERIGAIADRLYLASETDLSTLLGQVEAVKPDLLVVDSVQTISSVEVDGSAGNVSQVREVAASVIAAAKRRHMATLLVGHVTKDGSIAGPRVLEHLVDVVVQFEGERHSRLRLELHNDAEDTELDGRHITLEGRRPLVSEVQALMDQTTATNPRRTTSGVDHNRTAMTLAVLHKHAAQPVDKHDAYIATVGGARLTEPAADLAVAIAIASSLLEKPVPSGTVAFGEVGLAGEVRQCTGLQRRLMEAARLGFRRAIVPAGTRAQGQLPDGIQVLEVTHVGRAVGIALDL